MRTDWQNIEERKTWGDKERPSIKRTFLPFACHSARCQVYLAKFLAEGGKSNWPEPTKRKSSHERKKKKKCEKTKDKCVKFFFSFRLSLEFLLIFAHTYLNFSSFPFEIRRNDRCVATESLVPSPDAISESEQFLSQRNKLRLFSSSKKNPLWERGWFILCAPNSSMHDIWRLSKK